MKLRVGMVFLLLVFLVGCSKVDENQPTKNSQTIDVPDQESWQSVITITKDGKRVAEVWAGYIALYNEKQITLLKDSIHIDFFDREGKHNSILTADSGIVYNKTNNLVAEGNVVVISDSGIVLETEQLRWDNKKQKIVSDVPVRFTTATDTLIGDSFISDPDLRNYEIRNARGYSRRNILIKK